MLNHITLMGRLTKDPELRYTSNNTPVASFSLAVERDFGEKQTDFIECVAWRQIGEFISKYFAKGNMIAVSGRLQIRDWNDKDGNKRRSAEVVVESAYFCESKKDRDDYNTDEYRPATYEQGKQGVFVEVSDEDGGLPFEV